MLTFAALVLAGFAQEDYTDEHKIALTALQPKINEAIEKGCQYLMTIQNRDGSWSEHATAGHAGNHHLGITGLCLYTLIKSDVPLDHPSVKKALLYIQQAVPNLPRISPGGTTVLPPREKQEVPVKLTYDAGILLMCFHAALTHTEDKALKTYYLNCMQAVMEELNGGQNTGGIWSYPCGKERKKGGGGDLSNTQYAALGYRAALDMKLKPPAAALEELYKGTSKHQETLQWEEWPKELLAFIAEREKAKGEKPATGSIGTQAVPIKPQKKGMPVAGIWYAGTEAKPTHSMTTAGVAILAVCQQGLKDQGKLKDEMDKDMTDRVEAGYFWLDKNFAVNGNYYYMYGLERVGSILRRSYIGKHPWYLEGADFITKHQGANGSWSGEPNTCFAILFLRRATRISTGESRERVARGGGRSIRPDMESDVQLTGEGLPVMDVWISGFSEKVKQAYVADAINPGIRVAKVEYIVDGKITEVKGKPGKAWEAADKYPAELKIEGRGKHAVSAKVYVVRPDAPKNADGPVDALEAKAQTLDVQFVEPEWTERQARHRQLNLIVKQAEAKKPPVAKTSSNHSVGETRFEGKDAVDGYSATYWSCKADDKEPKITIELKEPINARTVMFCQLNRRLDYADADTFDRIKKVMLTLNNDPPIEVTLAPDDFAPTYFKLPKQVGIKKIEVKILDRDPAKGASKGQAGFTEIGLEAD